MCELPVNLGRLQCSYPSVPDPLRTPNENANVFLGICKDEKLLVLNNLRVGERNFPTRLLRQRSEFVSDLDVFIVSPSLIMFTTLLLTRTSLCLQITPPYQ